jgi:hypothetical protein
MKTPMQEILEEIERISRKLQKCGSGKSLSNVIDFLYGEMGDENILLLELYESKKAKEERIKCIEEELERWEEGAVIFNKRKIVDFLKSELKLGEQNDNNL